MGSFGKARSRLVLAEQLGYEQRSPKINFREIFRVVRFSTFATISALSGRRTGALSNIAGAEIQRNLHLYTTLVSGAERFVR